MHYFGAWHPDGNVSFFELEEPEPDEHPGHGAVYYLNDDCNDDVNVSAIRSAKMQAEADLRSEQGQLGIRKN
jgi:hypothetical protein